jgi:long-subunit fatty acid transport protein
MQTAPRRFFATLLILCLAASTPAAAQLPDGLNPDDFEIPIDPGIDPDIPLPELPLPPMANPEDILAGRLVFASSPNPVGSGARAIGMGGAFIGVADDATAASWNPAGLVQLKAPEVSVVFSGVHRVEDNHFPLDPEADGSESITDSDINYLSAVYPFNLFNRNMVVSLNCQYLYDFTRSWDFLRSKTDEKDIDLGGGFSETVTVETESRYRHDVSGSLSALGLAYSIQVIPSLSLGFTLNIWDDNLTDSEWESNNRLDIENVTTIASIGMVERTHILTKVKDNFSFEGINFNIGALWRATDKLSVGAVFKSPFKADIGHDRELTTFRNGTTVSDVRSSTDEKMRMPMSYGIGLAWRESDHLTVSMDFFRTHWEDLEIEDENGDKTSPITNMPPSESGIDPTQQIRLGLEYLLIDPEVDYVIPMRFGMFYDPTPAAGSPDDYYGFSLGTGFGKGRFILDLAYQFRYGNDVGQSLVGGSDFSQDVEEHLLYSSVILHF